MTYSNVIKLFFAFLVLINFKVKGAENPAKDIDPFGDVVLIIDGNSIYGEIIEISKNSIKIKNENGVTKIKNNNIALIGVSQELSSAEKYRLGILDGKRYAKNKGGNFAVGFFFGLIGTAVVYASSDQIPSYDAMINNDNIVTNDVFYLQGYSKGARKKSGGMALFGTGSALITLSVLTAVILNNLEEEDYYVYD